MTDNYIYTKEFYEEHPMYHKISDQLKLFVNQKVEFTIQGDEYTILTQFIAYLEEIRGSHSHIESGHLVANDFFIYLQNSLHIRFAIPVHQVSEIHRYSEGNIEFDCNLYRIKLRIADV